MDFRGIVARGSARKPGRLALAGLAIWLSPACGEPSQQPKEPLRVDVPVTERLEQPVREVQVGQASLPKVAFLGDGVSSGVHLAAEQAFPALLQRRMRGGAGFVLVPAGDHDATSEDGLRSVEGLIKQAPVAVVIELGQNDALQGISLKETEANLRAIIEKLQSARVKPLLLGIEVAKTHNGAQYAEGLAAIYPRIAAELQVPFVPDFMHGVRDHRELLLPDGLHPTPQGHERLAGNVGPALRALLTGHTP